MTHEKVNEMLPLAAYTVYSNGDGKNITFYYHEIATTIDRDHLPYLPR